MGSLASAIARGARTGLTRLCLVLVGLIALGGCDDPEPLTIGAHETWIGYQPLFLYEEISARESNAIVLKRLVNVSTAQQSFRSGYLDAIFATLDEAIRLKAQGLDICIVTVNDSSFGADGIITRKNIATFEALRGRRIGLMPVALDAYILARALELYGMRFDQIEIVPLEYDKRFAAFANGHIDAFIAYDGPMSATIADEGKIVFDTRDMPNEILSVLITKRETLEMRQDAFRFFVSFWAESIRILKQNRNQAIQQIASRRPGAVQDVERNLDNIRLYGGLESFEMLAGREQPILETAEKIQGLMLKLGLLDHAVDVSELVVPDLLEDIYAQALKGVTRSDR